MNSKKVWLLGLAFVLCVVTGGIFLGHDYQGTDDTVQPVIQVYADKAGTSVREPFLNTDRGDLLLFLFTVSGLICGFYLGYNWREMFGPKAKASKASPESKGHQA